MGETVKTPMETTKSPELPTLVSTQFFKERNMRIKTK